MASASLESNYAVADPADGVDAPPSLMRVLVVEGHPLMRAGIRAVLNALPDVQLVGEGATAEEALRLAHATEPDLIVLDIDACDDERFTTTRSLVALERHPRVLALTTLSEEEAIVQAIGAGASGLISRDAAEGDLATALRMAAAGEIYVRPRALSLLAASVRRRSLAPETRSAQLKFNALSDRERAVLEHVASGLTGPEIGALLHITAKTVDTYRHRIREKIGLRSRVDYIHFALVIGLLAK